MNGPVPWEFLLLIVAAVVATAVISTTIVLYFTGRLHALDLKLEQGDRDTRHSLGNTIHEIIGKEATERAELERRVRQVEIRQGHTDGGDKGRK